MPEILKYINNQIDLRRSGLQKADLIKYLSSEIVKWQQVGDDLVTLQGENNPLRESKIYHLSYLTEIKEQIEKYGN